jgi:hypothetical protein
MRRRPTTAAACAVTLLALGAAPAAAVTGPVDIRVSIAAAPGVAIDEERRTKVFAVDAVVPGDGPELTPGDFDPAQGSAATVDEFCGSIEVDVDPVAQTVTLTAPPEEVGCEISGLNVAVQSPEIDLFSAVSLDLVQFEPGEGAVEGDGPPGIVFANWRAFEGEVLVLTDGVTQLRYDLVADGEPTPTPTPAPEPEPEPTPAPEPAPAPAPAPAPVPAPAAPARPVVAQPTFTG